MKYLGKVLATVLIITALSFNFAPAGPAEVGDIVRQFGATGSSWAGGGLTWREGYLWENARGSATLYRRNPVTGDYMGTINYSIDGNKCVDVTWDTKRGTWWLTNPFAGLIEQIPYTGGTHIGSFVCTLWIAGIFYHEDTDRFWIGSNVNGGYGVYRADGYRESVVDLDYSIQGIARVGDHIWVGGPLSSCTKLNLNGSPTGVSFSLPNTDHMPQSFSFDGEYLWARAQAREGFTASPMVYQIDIGYNPPPTPTPTPAPTPAILVIDSGDYNGDGTSDCAVFRSSTGLWAVRGVTDFYYGRSGDIPVSGDYDGDGTTEAGVYRPSSGLWSIRGVTRAYFGSEDDIPVPGDYTGSKRCEIGIYNAASGLWAIRGVTRAYFGSAGDLPVPGYYDKDRPGVKLIATFRPSNALWASPGFTRTYFGRAGDLPVPGQYDQDDDNWEIGIFRSSTGLWSVLDERRFYFGSSEDRPVPADYEGDHWTDFAVFRSSSGLWSVQEVTRLYYGADGDVPVTGRVPRHFGPTPSPPPPILDSDDYDGDGTSDIAVFRPSNGLWSISGVTRTYFGQAGDVPVSGDYNGDGTTDIAFYRPSLGLWSVRGLTRAYFGGGADDIPVPGDYNGSGRCNMGIFRPQTGLWSIRHLTRLYFGGPGDLPIPDYYRGERAKDIAVFRPQAGLWSIRGYTRVYYGRSGDCPAPADVTGTGRTNLVLFRPSNALWLVHNVGTNYFGSPGDSPVPADYLGDGTCALGVFRDSAGLWSVRGVTRAYFGAAGDIPLPGRLPNPPEPPTVATETIYNVTTTTAEVVGEVTDQGSAPVTARGVCWSTTTNPTTGDSKTIDGSGTGAFLSDITGLSPGTGYHVRAYATNEAGTGYGGDEAFTTLEEIP